LVLELVINSFWLISFFINLNRVDFLRKITSFRSTFLAYLRSWLVLDLIALVGSVTSAFMGEFRYAKYFDLIRLLRFQYVLYPVYLCVEKNTTTGQKRIVQTKSLIFVFFAFITLGHLAACLWIYYGRMDEDLPPDERQSWLFVNDLTGEGEGNLPTPYEQYVFSLYWVFETFTTVGYGDYTPGTTNE